MHHYATPSLTNERPDNMIIHVGCNDILKGKNDPRKIAESIFEVARVCREGGVNRIFVSGILTMNNFNYNNIDFNEKT